LREAQVDLCDLATLRNSLEDHYDARDAAFDQRHAKVGSKPMLAAA